MPYDHAYDAHLRIRGLLLPMSLTVNALLNADLDSERDELVWVLGNMIEAAVPVVRDISEEPKAPAEVQTAVWLATLRLLALFPLTEVRDEKVGYKAEYSDALADAFDRLWSDFKDRDGGETWAQPVESPSTVGAA